MATHASNENWWTSFVRPCWSGYKDLDYCNERFNDPDALILWTELGYSQTKFTGDLYDMRQAEPVWMPELRKYFDWQHFSWAIYRMSPGCVLPQHSDTYLKFRNIYNIKDSSVIMRAIIFLEDWKQGHYFDIADRPIVSWRAGDTIIWRNDVPHTAANVGMQYRYTLQITGTSDAHTFL